MLIREYKLPAYDLILAFSSAYRLTTKTTVLAFPFTQKRKNKQFVARTGKLILANVFLCVFS